MEMNLNNQENSFVPDEKKKSCLRSPQMIFNIAAGVLILILLILQFYNPFSKENGIVVPDGGLNIAYVESDSIMTQYDLVDTLKGDLVKLNDSLDKDFTKRQEGFQARVNLFQQNVQNGKIQTKDDYSRQESALAAEQEQLMNLRDSYLAQVQQKQIAMNNQILDSIVSIIKQYPEEFPYDYVLDYNSGTGILYANDKLNITVKVVDRLNKEYNK
ncbi:MAG TPA: OmpH family outer membrane protein [Bacteroidales bacterium]|nr:OmpH family outer membrane protein [Bacteroidales bacterium]